MSRSIDLSQLTDALAGRAAAFRTRTRLQPAAGPGTKVFPPTYDGGTYAVEERRLPDREHPVVCVALDSVQSQANRMEEALQDALDRGRLGDAGLPIIEADFSPFFPGEDLDADLRLIDAVGRITSLEAPHRSADAIFRDSLVADGTAFPKSPVGLKLAGASYRNATPLFQHCPTSLLFGMWDSTGPKGGMGAKFERAIVSEIVGVDAVFGVRSSSRIDPLAILKGAGEVYEAAEGDIGWTLDPTKAVQQSNRPKKIGKEGKPSEVNHGNVTPSLTRASGGSRADQGAGGATIEYAEHTAVISLACLRRLRFPAEGVAYDPRDPKQRERDTAAQAVLAAMGLLATALAAEAGMDLRSRCVLWPSEQNQTWELLAGPGRSEAFEADSDQFLELYQAAVAQAVKLGLPWQVEPLTLRPSDSLVRLVAKSQQLAAAESVTAGDD